jgi:hypothetical protein
MTNDSEVVTIEEDEDLCETALEALAEEVKKELAKEGAGDAARCQVLSQFVLAAEFNFLVGEILGAIDGIKGVIASVGSAGIVSLLSQGLPAEREPQGPLGTSWVSEVLRSATEMNAGKKQILVQIAPIDGGEVDAEHVEIAERLQSGGWTLEQVNEALGKCARPAVVTNLGDL